MSYPANTTFQFLNPIEPPTPAAQDAVTGLLEIATVLEVPDYETYTEDQINIAIGQAIGFVNDESLEVTIQDGIQELINYVSTIRKPNVPGGPTTTGKPDGPGPNAS